MTRAASSAIPVFKLYGENQQWPTPDLLHCETISRRSREYQWEIQPHRHADLCQLLYVHKGQAQLEIEGQRSTLSESTLQVLPPLCVHGFRFSEDIEGYVVTLAAPLIAHLQGQLGAAMDGLSAVGSYPAGQDSDHLNSLFARLQDEYSEDFPARDMMMHAVVSVLLVWISRQAIQRRHSRMPRGREYFRRFTQLVEQHYREHPKIEDLAHTLGISVSHLNGTCRELGGQPALQIMHDRQLLEAKRLLTYTSMTINEMSEVLGFSDPTNFSRLFRRRVGFSPKAFREQLKADSIAGLKG
ncbi:helix-turn-helix domain-containing protein [Pseudomonas mucidolens]|uniref:Transcriptional regulator, AraC family n=1 Tax=Pseudomonas mucidolens TaxID=46679 RepID=A0A1H2N8K5_9PSED|nr:helix-turn-helix domain-containing protein [Pseudomonas mucidolens]SDV01800.1 transcriptional regulator, AraC family [Pseudomonas mucidolens]SQH32426.1 AraC family transcriptional regulator [Pseudomonas mucidolens]